MHARSVALVLSLLTGYVSPQFHIKFDDLFETVRDLNTLPESKWQALSRIDLDDVPKKKGKATPLQPDIQTEKRIRWHSEPLAPAPMAEGRAEEGDPLPLDPPTPEQVEDQGEEELPPSLPPEQGTTTRSGRTSVPPQRFIEAYAVLDDSDAVEDYELQRDAEDPIAFAANGSDPDSLYYNQAMKADDAREFKAAMLKEANAHSDGDHWEVWEKRLVPENQDILPAVWAFKRKRRIDTREVYKHKARLNIHGGKQTHGVNYWETYSPVVNWFSIRLCLTFSLLFDWHTRQIDFVLAFPQAEVECDLFMELPRGLIFEGVHRSTHCLKLSQAEEESVRTETGGSSLERPLGRGSPKYRFRPKPS
jgi:hypothetical protein